MASEAGKGSGRRRADIPADQYDQSHVRIFGEPKRTRWVPPPLSIEPPKPKGGDK